MRIERSDPITASNPGPDLISATARVQSVAPVTSNPVTPARAPVSVTLQLTPMAQESTSESSAVMRQGSFEASRLKAQQPTQAEKAAQHTGDPHVSLIRSMLEALTGVRVHVISGMDVSAESRPGAIPLSSESAVERVGRSVATGASGNPSLPIVADGIIRTLDRAEIHFRLELAMRREPGISAPTDTPQPEPAGAELVTQSAPLAVQPAAAPLPPLPPLPPAAPTPAVAPAPIIVADAGPAPEVSDDVAEPVIRPPLPPLPAQDTGRARAADPPEPLIADPPGSIGAGTGVPAAGTRQLPGVANFDGKSSELRSGTYVVALEVAAPEPLIADATLQTHVPALAAGGRAPAHADRLSEAGNAKDSRKHQQYALFELKIGTAVNTQA